MPVSDFPSDAKNESRHPKINYKQGGMGVTG